jgi:hypothetical protein
MLAGNGRSLDWQVVEHYSEEGGILDFIELESFQIQS